MAATPKKVVIAFDLYGTLLSTDSIAHELAEVYGKSKAESIATAWRRYQLEYTWRINTMGEYKPFNEITRNALGHAVAEHGKPLSTEDADALMTAYDKLHVFPEIPAALGILEEWNSDPDSVVEAYIFSNGTDEMVGNSVKTSPDLGPHADKFKSLITVHSLQCYKPDRRVYAHLVQETGMKGQAGNVWVVSGNPFDIVGAKAAGLRAAFIDRQGKGWIDRLDTVRVPSIIANGVDEAIKSILNY